MNSKLISVIIPAYNTQRYIERCVNSVLSQTYDNVEIIVIDDGSTDNTEEKCRQFKKNAVLKYFKTPNRGVSSARNLGIEKANGEYIFFVDADDFLEKNYCKSLVDIMESKDVAMVICGYKTVDCENTIEMIPAAGEYSVKEFLKMFLSTPFVNMPWGRVYRKEYISKLFNINKSMGEDFEFNMNYIENIDRICCIDKALYNYNCGNANSLTKDIFALGKAILENIKVLEKMKHCDEKLIKSFFNRRIRDYLNIIFVENRNNPIELMNTVASNYELKMYAKTIGSDDLVTLILFSKWRYLLIVVYKAKEILKKRK